MLAADVGAKKNRSRKNSYVPVSCRDTAFRFEIIFKTVPTLHLHGRLAEIV